MADHKAPDFVKQLAKAYPDGIDVYFESVGGRIRDAVLPLLNTRARVPVCGLISLDESRSGGFEGVDRLPGTMAQIMGKSLTVRGFIQAEFAAEQHADFLREAGQWLSEGKLCYREHVVQGLDKVPNALIDPLTGWNFGRRWCRSGTHEGTPSPSAGWLGQPHVASRMRGVLGGRL